MSRLSSPYLWLGLFAAGVAFAVAAALLLVGATVGVDRGIEAFAVTALGTAAATGWWRAYCQGERTRAAEQALDVLRQSAEGMALRDPLTGLGNYRLFMTNMRGAFARAQRYAQTFSVLLVEVNLPEMAHDDASVSAYERLLKYLGTIVATNLRAADTTARYSESMFAMVLYETDYEGAMIAWDRLRHVARENWPEGRLWSIFGGAATYSVDTVSIESLLSDADRRLALEKRRLRAEPES